ncbi:MAG TPA: mechanosensitive ion channel domain-containing protein [Pyrinomonadaceae bacterium]|jgi:small-conductance mechanosensitive channel
MTGFKDFGSGKAFSKKVKTSCFALTLSAVVFGAIGVPAQNTAPSVPPAGQTPGNVAPVAAVSPTPIPYSDVIAQAENAASTLKEIAASASSDPAADTIERDLPALTDEINARLVETAQTVEGSTSLDNLRSFEADWRTLTRKLPDWRNDLTARARKLEGDLRRLDELSEKWQKTLAELRTTETPPEVQARIEDIIAAAAETRRSIVTGQSRVVALQNRVAEQQTRVEEALRTIAARRDALVGRLLVRDSPPIWGADFWTRGGIREGIRDSLRTQFEGLGAFAERNKDKLIIHILIFVAFAGLLFYLRRRARPLVEADPQLKQAAVIFYLPVPTALVLAIFFSSWIYPQTPQILGALFGAIALVPTVVILRKLIERSLYPLLYALVAFYFIDQLRAIFEDLPMLTRPLFLLEMLAAFLFFWWFYRARLSTIVEAAGGEKRGRVFRTIRTAAIVVLPFFAVAFLANIFGYVNLARLVGDAVLRSAYTAVFLYGAVRIVDGLIVFALRFRPLNLLKMVQNYAPTIQEKLQKFTRFVALALWLLITLEFFTLRAYFFGKAGEMLTAELSLGSLSISAADVLLFFAVVWAAFLISRFVRFALEEDFYPRFELAHGVSYAISTIVNYVILLVGFFFAVGAAGFDLTRFTVLVGAFGVGIGFGLQNIFNNFVSGLILLFERPVRIGDEIQIGEASGTVRRIGIRASRIRLWDNSEVIVPNSKLISENVKNWSFSARKRGVEVRVSVAPGTDPERVIALLTEVARAHPLVADKPPPQVILSELASLNFRLRAWTAKSDQATRIASDLAIAVNRKFAENGIEFPDTGAAPVSL